MTENKESKYCRIYLSLEENDVISECGNFNDVLKSISLIGIKHSTEQSLIIDKLKKNDEYSVLEDYDSVDEICFSIVLVNRSGCVLQLGVCEVGWSIIEIESESKSGSSRLVRGNIEGDGVVAILMPEWTEFEYVDLIDKTTAQKIVLNWLTSNKAE